MTKTAKIYGDSLYDLAAEEKLTEEILPQILGTASAVDSCNVLKR